MEPTSQPSANVQEMSYGSYDEEDEPVSKHKKEARTSAEGKAQTNDEDMMSEEQEMEAASNKSKRTTRAQTRQ